MNRRFGAASKSPMSAKLCAAALLAACVLLAAPAARALDRSSLLHLAPSVLKIEAISPEGRFQLGSGVIVADRKVVTNCHVTRHAERLHVVKGGVRWPARAQAADVEHDLCVLDVPLLEGDPVPIAAAVDLKVGQSVLAMGYTGGVGMQLSEGAVVALHRWSGSSIIQSSNWFSSGASGGGLFDAQGTLVGILTFRLRGGAAHYFAAPADWVRTALDDPARFQRPAPLPGRSFWERPAEEQPEFLQAAALEQQGKWPALAGLAERWAETDAGDPEAFYLLGVAYDGLQRHTESVEALQRCLQIDPSYSRAWARLARIHKRQGRLGDARQALARLASLDAARARDLTNELEQP